MKRPSFALGKSNNSSLWRAFAALAQMSDILSLMIHEKTTCYPELDYVYNLMFLVIIYVIGNHNNRSISVYGTKFAMSKQGSTQNEVTK